MNYLRVKSALILVIFLGLFSQSALIYPPEATAGLFDALGRAGKTVVSPVTGLFSGHKGQEGEKVQTIAPEEGKSVPPSGKSQPDADETGIGSTAGELLKSKRLMRPPGKYLTTIDGVAAIINQDIITMSELEEQLYDRLMDIKKNYSGAELQKMTENLERERLKQMVNEKLQLSAAKKYNIDVPDKDIEAAIAEIKKEHSLSDEGFNALLNKNGIPLDEYKSQLRDQILLRKVQNFSVRSRVQVDEKEISEYYSKNLDKFKEPDQVHARQIFFLVNENSSLEEINKVRGKADAVLRMAKSGADFAQLATKYSEDTSGDKGGDLGFFKREELLPALENVAFSLGEGEISGLIRTKYGFHIIKVEKLKGLNQKPLEAVKDNISKILFKKRADEKLEEWLNELRQDAFIKMMI